LEWNVDGVELVSASVVAAGVVRHTAVRSAEGSHRAKPIERPSGVTAPQTKAKRPTAMPNFAAEWGGLKKTWLITLLHRHYPALY